MRSILTLSLPPDLAAFIRRQAKNMGMSLSEYARRVFRSQEHLISEEELLERSREAMRNYRAGRCKVLKTEEDIERFFRDIGA